MQKCFRGAPKVSVGPGRIEHHALQEEHDPRLAIMCGLQTTEEHLQNQGVWPKVATGVVGESVEDLLVGGRIIDRMVEGIVVTGAIC